MYTINQVERIKTLIENKIYVERLTYFEFYEVIEEYLNSFSSSTTGATGSAIMVGGTMGVNLLLKKERNIQDFVYELYAENAFLHANNLINLLEELNSKTKKNLIILLKTTIPNNKYQIIIDNRPMVIFYKLSENSFDLVLPVKTKTFDNKKEVLVVSPEIQLIDIYRTLYSPNKSDIWQENIEDEKKLFQHLKQRIQQSTSFAFNYVLKKGSDDITGGEEIKNEDKKLIELELFKQYIVNNKNVILIGEHAVKLLTNLPSNSNIIQVISANTIEQDFIEVENIVKKTFKRNIPVVKITRKMHVMQDFRITRTSIKIGDEHNQKEILYIYNSGFYDLIPFNTFVKDSKSSIQVGNPFVLIRFLLIDFWMVRWIKILGSIDNKYANQRLDSILNKILFIRNMMSNDKLEIDKKYFNNSANPKLKVFTSNTNEYLGHYDDENISQKVLIKDLSKKYYDYFPSEYYKKNKSYRVVENFLKSKDQQSTTKVERELTNNKPITSNLSVSNTKKLEPESASDSVSDSESESEK